MSSLFDLTGKTALVVGGAGGIGTQLSKALAREGSNIALVDLNEEKLKSTAAEVTALGVETFTYPCDISDPDSVRETVAAVADHFGHIDILVNCVGISISHRSDELYIESWRKVMGVNLDGTFYMCREVGKLMIEQNYGKIINLTSGFGTYVPANTLWPLAPYCTSKGGMTMLTKALAVEWAPYNITVNAIAPGWFRSELANHSIDNPKLQEQIEAFYPMRRIGNPGELDGACILLASDASSYITGQTIFVDGGCSCV